MRTLCLAVFQTFTMLVSRFLNPLHSTRLPGSAEAEALDAGQDVVSGLGPAERFRVSIGGLDVRFDGLFEIGNRTEHPSLEGAFGQ